MGKEDRDKIILSERTIANLKQCLPVSLFLFLACTFRSSSVGREKKDNTSVMQMLQHYRFLLFFYIVLHLRSPECYLNQVSIPKRENGCSFLKHDVSHVGIPWQAESNDRGGCCVLRLELSWRQSLPQKTNTHTKLCDMQGQFCYLDVSFTSFPDVFLSFSSPCCEPHDCCW